MGNPYIFSDIKKRLAGIGQRKYRSKLGWQSERLDARSLMYLLGVGIEMKLYKGLHLTGQYRLTQDKKRWEHFMLKATRTRHEFSAGLQWQF